MSLGRSNTFLLSVIYTLVWRSQRAVSFLRPGLERTGREWGCLMGVGAWAADGWQENGRDRRWGRGTEDKLRLLVKTPDFGTKVRGQFRAIFREPGFLHTPHLPRTAAPICDLGCVQQFEDSGNSSKNFHHELPSDKGSFSSLAVQEWANGERNTTRLSRVSPGKDNLLLLPFLAHITVSLDPMFFYICLSSHLWDPGRRVGHCLFLQGV